MSCILTGQGVYTVYWGTATSDCPAEPMDGRRVMYTAERRALPTTDLLSRLHLGAENSDVLQMVSWRTAMRTQAVSANEQSHTLSFFPKPPPGNMEARHSIIRTSICREDRRRRNLRKLRDQGNKRRGVLISSQSPEDMAPSWNTEVRGNRDLLDIAVGEKLQQRGRLQTDLCQDNASDDSAISHIHRLRSRLGWKTEFPNLAPGTRRPKADRYNRLLEVTTKEDRGEFVYCLPRCRNSSTARYDPYDLQVVPAATAVHCDLYWTLSASQVSKVSMVTGAEMMETVPLTEWLYEREKYYAIKNKPVFSQFRLWKAFTVWKMNIRRSKTDNSRTILLQQLFLADEWFQGCLCHFQSLCQGAVNIRCNDEDGDFPVLFVKLDDTHTYSLKDFCDLQTGQCDKGLSNLQALRGRIIPVITQTFLKVAETTGFKHLFLSDTKPSYIEISEWRNLQDRFRRFLSLLDSIFQEALRSVVTNSAQMLLRFFEASSDVTSAEEKKNYTLSEEEKPNLDSYLMNERGASDNVPNTPAPGIGAVKEGSNIRRNRDGKQSVVPVFAVSLVLQSVVNVGQHIATQTTSAAGILTRKSDKDAHLPPSASGKPKSGAKKEVTFQQETTDLSDSEGWDEEGEDGDEPLSGRSSAVSKNFCIFPSANEFDVHMRGVVDGFEQTIGRISPLSQETSFSRFCRQPGSDEKTLPHGETNWQWRSIQKTWPNCELLLGMDSDYQSQVKNIFSSVKLSMERVEAYSSHFKKFCTMVEAAENVKAKMTTTQVELSPEEYRGILDMFNGFIVECQQMNIERRVHLVKVRSLEFQTSCLQHLQSLVNMIRTSLPAVAYARNLQLLEVIHRYLQRLNRELKLVEEFVEHLTFLGQVSSELPSMETQYNTIIQLYAVAKDYSINIPIEDTALYQSLIPSFQQLKSAVLFCQAKKNEDIIQFSGDLDKYISDLHFELMEFKIKVRNPILLEGDTYPLKAKEIIASLLDEFEILANRARYYSSYQERFGSSITQMKAKFVDLLLSKKTPGAAITAQTVSADISEVECDLSLRKLLWEAREEWASLSTEWRLTSFESLNVDVIQRDVNRFSHTLFMLEKGLPANVVVTGLKQSIMDFKQSLPIVVALRNPCLQARHWDVIHFTIGRMITRDKNFTLGSLLELRIFQHKDKITDISTTATNEATLQGMLDKVVSLWNKTNFKLTAHQSELSEILLIASAEDITAQLEESQVTLSTVKSSRYCQPIKNIVDEWDRKLSLFARTMEEWMRCQRNWLYLEQIFLASDIQRQLPAEAKLFSQVDLSWKELMNYTKDRPNALRAATVPGVLEVLQTNNAHLEKILKCLEDFLEIKRRIFPRFYFLSNDDLLAILAESKNPDVVQPHLVKCFENIRHLDIRRHLNSPPEVETIISAEGEKICMPKNIRVRGPVEQWLGNVETSMFDVVKKMVRVGVLDWGQSDFKKWLLTHSGQAVLVVSQIMFNKDCVRSFSSAEPEKELGAVLCSLEKRLGELADMALEIPSAHQKTTLEALLTHYVHCRDVLTELIKNKVLTPDDFEWTRQLRYEWNEQNNSCYVVQGGASFTYGYEYLGCSSRLVITPLTDRCWLTLTGALDLHLGGSPAGPAGTGKTETVKDLAKALGKQCVVFNCSEGLDYKIMGKFFSGIAQSGAWCCFDEFNRIDAEVLSVIASQIHAIKSAKDGQAIRFVFEGREIRLNMSCGIFITMNPGYQGRVELPDNLKSLFRPVAMMVPDYQLIVEIMLFSEGFKAAKSLSGKLVNLYQLTSKQLSQQNHYDFGMRAIKTVLVMAGQRKHDLESREKKTRLTLDDETLIIISALKEANLPKFLAEDVPLFESIMADLFPGVAQEKTNTKRLEKAISAALHELCLQPWESQTQKVIQFYHQIVARHGVMLVGPTGGGKTAVRRILEKALVHLPTVPMDRSSPLNVMKKGKVETFIINPKCVTLGELYGEIDPNTMEWSDGLLASAVRTFTQQSSKGSGTTDLSAPQLNNENNMKGLNDIPKAENEDFSDSVTPQPRGDAVPDWYWIILDGPVDTMWVENLNTVLDDTRTLCLANSERIRLPQGMRMIFEVDSLSQASPATVSRCAMVYMDPVDLGWKPFLSSWVSKISTKVPLTGVQCLNTLIATSVDEGIKFIHRHKSHLPFPVQDLVPVMNLCKILDAFIDFMSGNGGFGELNHDLNEKLSSLSNVHETQSTSDTRALYSPSLTGSLMKRGEQKWFLENNPEKLTPLLGKLYVFAFTWAFGCLLTREDEQEGDSLIGLRARDESLVNVTQDFSNFVHDLFEGDPASGVQMPLGGSSVFSYFVDLQTGKFVPWDSLVPSTESSIQKESLLFSELSLLTDRGGALQKCVPTVDSVRYSFLTSLLLLHKQPVLLTGDSGVGKSTLIQNMLERLQKPDGLSVKAGTVLGDVFLFNEAKKMSLLQNITSIAAVSGGDEDFAVSGEGIEGSLLGLMSAGKSRTGKVNQLVVSMVQLGPHTSASKLQSQILSKLVKKGRDTLGTPRSKQVTVFIDDLNMPNPEPYGAQPPLELIRQFLELGGFYDTKTLTWKNIQDVSLVAACAPPGGGRHEISPRLLKHFCMFNLPHPSVQALQHIFQVQLGSFLLRHNFLAEVQNCRDLVSSCAIAIYYKMCHLMLPTPAKCHYTFNLRDLFKVLQGLLQANESVTVTKDMAAQLLVHEASRVFQDRLVDSGDREIFYQCLADELHSYFKVTWPVEKLMSEPVLFVDFLENLSAKNRVYRPVTNHRQLVSKLEEFRMRMSSVSAASAYVFFTEAVHHITRAARVFRQPGGHMMLVGVDGTGKVSCAALACYISNCKLFRLSVTQSYGNTEFREELKKVYKETGLLGKSVVLLITGADIIKDSFLEDINCILNSGEVPDLFDKDELDGLFVDLKAEAAEVHVSDSPQSMLAFFLQRVRSNLHVVLALSPAGQTFREHCRSHPSLVNCCTVDWYNEWPEEALLSVAEGYITEQDLLQNNTELQSSVTQVCVAVHKSVSSKAAQYLEETRRHYYVTPQSYLSFIDTFSNILQAKKQKLTTDRNRFFTGLSKLLEATSSIEIMQYELVALGPQIEQKSKEIEALMGKLQRDSIVVEQVRAIVKQEEEVMAQETRIVQDYAQHAQRELREALPALEEAVTALDSLDKSDISEVKVYTHPPFLVLTVMNAVCVLLQKTPDWATAKLLLGDPGSLKRLVSLDKDGVPEKVFQKLKKYSSIPDFTPQKVGAVSTACRSLCQWVVALEHYHEVHKTVIPKKRRVAEAQEALRLAQERLRRKQASLSLVEEHQERLQKEHSDRVAEKAHLADRKRLTTQRLARASLLITALDEEKVRWKESVDRLDLRLEGIIGDILVSAAFIVYCGVFTSEYRAQLVEQWLEFCNTYKIPVSEDYSLIRAMAAKNEVRQWQNEGLPPDPYSTENAILVKNGQRWPLLVDPHGQAHKWICQMEGERLWQANASDPNYMKTLETAIRLGEPILLQDVSEDLDPSLKPILGKEIRRRAGQDFIQLGDSEIEYNQNFRLYMSTQAPSPHFLPAVCIMVTLINFTVTYKGLADQLLSSVVSIEQPQLEMQRCHILESITADLRTLRKLEERSLTLLQKTEGHLLDDEDLIETLQKSKVTSKDILKRMKDSGETEATIEAARGIYLPVAERGAVLYFVVADLIHLNYMYQFSLHWFKQVFVESMKVLKPSQTLVSMASFPDSFRMLSRQRTTGKQEAAVQRDATESHLHSVRDSLERTTGEQEAAVHSEATESHLHNIQDSLQRTTGEQEAAVHSEATESHLHNIRDSLQRATGEQEKAVQRDATESHLHSIRDSLERTTGEQEKAVQRDATENHLHSIRDSLERTTGEQEKAVQRDATESHLHSIRDSLERTTGEQEKAVHSEATESHLHNIRDSLHRTTGEQEAAVHSEATESHLRNICDSLTRSVYKIVSSSLFTEHKLCFSFMLTVSIMRNRNGQESGSPGSPSQREWDFFLHSLLLSNLMEAGAPAGGTGLDEVSENALYPEKREQSEDATAGPLRRGVPGWLSDDAWRQCRYLSHHLQPFSTLCDSLSSGAQQWGGFRNAGNLYDLLSEPCESPGFPSQDDMSQRLDPDAGAQELRPKAVYQWETLTSFQKLILIKVLRSECLTSAIQEFIVENMGAEYVGVSAINLKQALEESEAATPLIFILSSGTDPAGQLERLSLESRGSTLHLDMVSLGRGQGVKAEELINKAKRLKGHWVFLQNCHLAASFMPRLREIVDGFEQQRTFMDPQFRLWLSSKSDQCFPVSILQKGFKMAVEPPRGLKGKLLQTFDSGGVGLITEKIFEKENNGLPWKKLLFSLCLFNAVVNERRKYGALGWTVPYEFTFSDLEVAVQMLGNLTDGRREIPWKAAHYLTGEVVYGGRVTDLWDRRCLLSILDNFYSPTALQDGYSFSADNVYRPLSDNATLQDCRDYINSLPEADTPEIFGMHPNAERAYLRSQAQAFLDTVLSMQPRISAQHGTRSGEYSQDQMVLELITGILRKLPASVERKAAPEEERSDETFTLSELFAEPAWEMLLKTTKGYDPVLNSTLLTVLHQEIDRFDRLLSVMRSSLRALRQAVRGEIILNRELEEVYDSLVSLKVPQLWQRWSYESCKLLGSWVDDLVQRLDFFATWSGRVVSRVQERYGQQLGVRKPFTHSHPNSSQASSLNIAVPQLGEPHSYWLPAFFFPQGFLTAVLQNYARMRYLSVDSLTFSHKVQPVETRDVDQNLSITDMAFTEQRPPEEGILVFGLFLDNGRWNPETQALEECDLDRFYPLPQIHFIPQTIQADSAMNKSSDHQSVYMYECPLYMTPQRAGTLSSNGQSTNFVTAVSLPTLVRPSHWIQRGVTLLCQITD
ncbi:dynein axonemal heavy chain 14 isoform X3 [Pseudophryne corroboree]|uniref:dynein axonemal heavy chain 14 isoform X3 n=1 Tax=Pseudophryne corroboree TaxID=495146 RepID=UPI003081CCF0